ncbi:hypothetical protein ABPG72_016740 [Tetrahymena utriculariae]
MMEMTQISSLTSKIIQNNNLLNFRLKRTMVKINLKKQNLYQIKAQQYKSINLNLNVFNLQEQRLQIKRISNSQTKIYETKGQFSYYIHLLKQLEERYNYCKQNIICPSKIPDETIINNQFDI